MVNQPRSPCLPDELPRSSPIRPERKETKTHRCITCEAEISEEEYERNEGQCDNCIAEDTVYAAPEEFGF